MAVTFTEDAPNSQAVIIFKDSSTAMINNFAGDTEALKAVIAARPDIADIDRAQIIEVIVIRPVVEEEIYG